MPEHKIVIEEGSSSEYVAEAVDKRIQRLQLEGKWEAYSFQILYDPHRFMYICAVALRPAPLETQPLAQLSNPEESYRTFIGWGMSNKAAMPLKRAGYTPQQLLTLYRELSLDDFKAQLQKTRQIGPKVTMEIVAVIERIVTAGQ